LDCREKRAKRAKDRKGGEESPRSKMESITRDITAKRRGEW